MSTIHGSDTEDSLFDTSTSDSDSDSEISIDYVKIENEEREEKAAGENKEIGYLLNNNDIKSINLGNKQFEMKQCNSSSSGNNKIIVRIENNPFELLVKKGNIIKDQCPTVNKNQKCEHIEHQEHSQGHEFHRNEPKETSDNIIENQESGNGNGYREHMMSNSSNNLQLWNRIIREAINGHLISMFNEETIENIAKEFKENVTAEVKLLINNTTIEISRCIISEHLSKIIPGLIKQKIYKCLQMKILEAVDLNKENNQSEAMRDLTATLLNEQDIHMQNLEDKDIKNHANLYKKPEQCPLGRSMIQESFKSAVENASPLISTENKEKQSTEETILANESRESYIARMDLKNMGTGYKRSCFVDNFFAFMNRRGSPITEVPMFGTSRLDFYLLYKEVISRGGYTEVTKNNLWKNVMINLGTPCTFKYAPRHLKKLYEKYLFSYECEKNFLSKQQNLLASESNKRQQFKEIVSQRNDHATSVKSESSNTQINFLPISINQISKTLLRQPKKSLYLCFQGKETNRKEFTKDQPLRLETNESRVITPYLPREFEISSTLGTLQTNDSRIKMEIESKKESTKDYLPEKSSKVESELKLVSKSKPEIKLTPEEKLFEGEYQIETNFIFNSEFKITIILFSLVALICLFLLQLRVLFNENTDFS